LGRFRDYEEKKIKVYNAASAGRVLGVKANTMTVYATRHGIGTQPGGPDSAWIFALEDLTGTLEIKDGDVNHDAADFLYASMLLPLDRDLSGSQCPMLWESIIMSTWCECAIVEGALLLIMMLPEPHNFGPPLC